MNLAALIKKGSLRETATATPATVATDQPDYLPSVASVATVAVAVDNIWAANDPGESKVTAKVTGKTVVTGEGSYLKVPSDPVEIVDPDRWCWPHSSAMNGAEIGTFAARLHQFTHRGFARNDSEALADKLVFRDRDQDDRRVCLECKHFVGHRAGSWRCGNWLAASVAIQSIDALLPADLVVQLQRCNGFAAKEASKSLSGSEAT